MAASDLTAARLRELLGYDPDSGVFTHRIKRSRNTVAGAPVKCSNEREARIRLEGRLYLAHRLAWLYMTGEWPTHEVDHVDGSPRNNRWSNLRDVPHAINLQNLRKARIDNAEGLLGVSKRGGKFIAQIKTQDGGGRVVGSFDSAEEASNAYLDAKRRLHPGCTI